MAAVEHGAAVCLLTTTANELVRVAHDRMPVILPRQAWEAWFSPGSEPEVLTSLLVPYPADEMSSLAVNPVVGHARNEGPQCIEPAAAQGSQF